MFKVSILVSLPQGGQDKNGLLFISRTDRLKVIVITSFFKSYDLCIDENSVPVSDSSVGVGVVLDAETLEETVIVLAATGVLTTKVLLPGIAAKKECDSLYLHER